MTVASFRDLLFLNFICNVFISVLSSMDLNWNYKMVIYSYFTVVSEKWQRMSCYESIGLSPGGCRKTRTWIERIVLSIFFFLNGRQIVRSTVCARKHLLRFSWFLSSFCTHLSWKGWSRPSVKSVVYQQGKSSVFPYR